MRMKRNREAGLDGDIFFRVFCDNMFIHIGIQCVFHTLVLRA